VIKRIVGVSMVITRICFYIFIYKYELMKGKQIDYQVLFSAGIIFLGSGTVFLISVSDGVGAGLILLGGSFMIIGGNNKDKWKNKK
jgi:hypothetical protein